MNVVKVVVVVAVEVLVVDTEKAEAAERIREAADNAAVANKASCIYWVRGPLVPDNLNIPTLLR